jgi:hypothetical protein
MGSLAGALLGERAGGYSRLEPGSTVDL